MFNLNGNKFVYIVIPTVWGHLSDKYSFYIRIEFLMLIITFYHRKTEVKAKILASILIESILTIRHFITSREIATWIFFASQIFTIFHLAYVSSSPIFSPQDMTRQWNEFLFLFIVPKIFFIHVSHFLSANETAQILKTIVFLVPQRRIIKNCLL